MQLTRHSLALAALTVNAFRADTRAQRPPSAAARGFLLGAGIALLAFVLTAPLDPGSIASYTTTLATSVVKSASITASATMGHVTMISAT